jgi:hypothetical protein
MKIFSNDKIGDLDFIPAAISYMKLWMLVGVPQAR